MYIFNANDEYITLERCDTGNYRLIMSEDNEPGNRDVRVTTILSPQKLDELIAYMKSVRDNDSDV